MPVWQSLTEELAKEGLDRDFTVLAVAMDQPDAARPWIEAAKPVYPCLIDRDHVLADLYHLVNVPQAVWIEKNGRIVRPPETAGSTDGFRAMDRKTFTVPDAVIAERTRVKAAYMDAVRDWAKHGSASSYALDAGRAAERMKLPDDNVAEAHARFRLGMHVLRDGRADEAAQILAEASRLHPDSWAIWRQAAQKDGRGLAAGPAFWARVDALGARHYYEPPDLGTT